MVSSESLLKAASADKLPPVELWDPDYCGELNLQIKSDGSWFYEGTPIGRRRMQVLFSRILKKENDDYFLVTPVEKVKIQVDWTPFTIIDFDQIESQNKIIYRFVDNCDNQVDLVKNDQLCIDHSQGQPLPLVNIRRNLFASFSRSCYYRLLDTADLIEDGDRSHMQIESNGITFNLGEFTAE